MKTNKLLNLSLFAFVVTFFASACKKNNDETKDYAKEIEAFKF
jgi:uncharacterized lipoprotein YehR (DUF1307 family)